MLLHLGSSQSRKDNKAKDKQFRATEKSRKHLPPGQDKKDGLNAVPRKALSPEPPHPQGQGQHVGTHAELSPWQLPLQQLAHSHDRWELQPFSRDQQKVGRVLISYNNSSKVLRRPEGPHNHTLPAAVAAVIMAVTAGQPGDMTGIDEGMGIWHWWWARPARPSLTHCPSSAASSGLTVRRPWKRSPAHPVGRCKRRKSWSASFWCPGFTGAQGQIHSGRSTLASTVWNGTDTFQSSLLLAMCLNSPAFHGRPMLTEHPLVTPLRTFWLIPPLWKPPRIICPQKELIGHLSSPMAESSVHICTRPSLESMSACLSPL